jgi:hypothetical protein
MRKYDFIFRARDEPGKTRATTKRARTILIGLNLCPMSMGAKEERRTPFFHENGAGKIRVF